MWEALLGFIISFAATFILTPFIARRHMDLGIVGRDVHKPGNPLIPEMGGLAIVISFTLSCVIVSLVASRYCLYMLTLLLCFLFAAFIGMYDDLRGLRPKVKVALTVLCCIPIVIAASLDPAAITLGRPILPLLGRLRLTIIYWALLPFAVAVPANAVNMMDVYNGVMPATCLIVSSALLVSGLILNKVSVVFMASPLIGSLAAYYYYNRYPARVFSGDTGSLAVGAAIGAMAVLSGLEMVGIVALMPHIMNAFHSLASIKGLLERREIKRRPTIVEDGLIKANPDPEAPLTLANLILSGGPLREPELVKCYVALSGVAFILAILTALLMEVTL